MPALHVDVPQARSVRTDGTLHMREVPELTAATTAAVRAALDHNGSIAVITTDFHLSQLTAAMHADGITVTTANEDRAGGHRADSPSRQGLGVRPRTRHRASRHRRRGTTRSTPSLCA